MKRRSDNNRPKFDLTGMRFGRLTVISQGERTNGRIGWLCKCDCGNIKTICGKNLKNGMIQSCGCYRKESFKERITKHNKCYSRLYITYNNMIRRCTEKNNRHWNRYGGRGISVCSEWINDFESFYNWAINNGYSEELTIDRINNDGNYEPSNCRWVSVKENNNNRSTCRFYTINGITKNIQQWCNEFGADRSRVVYRLNQGKDIETSLALALGKEQLWQTQ